MEENFKKTFIIIGAGIAGILAAIRLKQSGFQKIVIFEKNNEIGGIWRDNRYPGVTCDVPSYLYCYSFEIKPDWTYEFSPGNEIYSYLIQVAKKYEIYSLIKFNNEVTNLEFLGSNWKIQTKTGIEIFSNYVIVATGIFHNPKIPNFKGLNDFKGEIFHSSEWPQNFDLTDKKLGIIGTGSTAVQIVTSCFNKVKKLYLFQRSPAWVIDIPNNKINNETKQKLINDKEFLKKTRIEISTAFINIVDKLVYSTSPEIQQVQEKCLKNIEKNITDEELKKKLIPNYIAGCKRIIISPKYYEAISSPNCNLVISPIESFLSNGIKTVDGNFYELNSVVLATGFEVDKFLKPIKVIGRNSISLDNEWNPRPYAFMTVMVPNFPNLFILNGPSGPLVNMTEVAEIQMNFILKLIENCIDKGYNIISPKIESSKKFEEERIKASEKTPWVTGCKNHYLDEKGVSLFWPWSFQKFREIMKDTNFDDFIFEK